jgi:ribosomal protein S12 methylthiotransferase accessory factor YcaO
MMETAKLPTFFEDYAGITSVLRLSSEKIPFHLSRIQAADRPDGFRRSKYIAVFEAKSAEFSVQGDGESLVSESEAIAKATSEAVERLCMKVYATRFNYRETSSGWAAHPNLTIAKMNAALELFERDAALVQWLRAAPLLEIQPHQLPWSIKWWKWTELAKSEFPDLKVMITTEGYFPTVVIVLKNKTGHGVVGTASSTDLTKAIDSALIEACRSALHFIRGTYSDESAALLAGKSIQARPGAHTLLYSKYQQLPEWFTSPKERMSWESAEYLCNQGKLSLAMLEARMDFELIGTDNCRIVVKARSPKLQPIFWGQTTNAKDLNFERIERTRNTMNLLPHVVG